MRVSLEAGLETLLPPVHKSRTIKDASHELGSGRTVAKDPVSPVSSSNWVNECERLQLCHQRPENSFARAMDTSWTLLSRHIEVFHADQRVSLWTEKAPHTKAWRETTQLPSVSVLCSPQASTKPCPSSRPHFSFHFIPTIINLQLFQLPQGLSL